MSIAIKPESFIKPKLPKWLWGLLVSIPIIGISYVAYNQLVVVPQQ